MKTFKIVLISCVWLTAFGQQKEKNDENKNLSVAQMSTFREIETGADCLFLTEEMPLFAGEYADSLTHEQKRQQSELELLKFIINNFQYPNNLDHCYYTKIIFQITIQKNGKISNLKFLKSTHESFEEEVERIVQMMPTWIPGKQNGQVVSVCYTIPLNIHLE